MLKKLKSELNVSKEEATLAKRSLEDQASVVAETQEKLKQAESEKSKSMPSKQNTTGSNP